MKYAIQEVVGYKDAMGKFHATQEEAEKTNFRMILKSLSTTVEDMSDQIVGDSFIRVAEVMADNNFWETVDYMRQIIAKYAAIEAKEKKARKKIMSSKE